MLKKENPLVPTLSETWLWGESVGGSLPRVQGQTHSYEIVRPGYHCDSAGRLIYATRISYGRMVFTSGLPLPSINLVSLGWW